MKLCECGCGQPAPIAKQDYAKRGWIKGQPVRFVRGHVGRLSVARAGVYRVASRAGGGRPIREHVRVAEVVLGRPLPRGSVVHHVNGKRDDNRPSNLVICENRGYHALLHQRARALAACGNANWRPCVYCHRHDDLARMHQKHSGSMEHIECRRAYYRRRNAARAARRSGG